MKKTFNTILIGAGLMIGLAPLTAQTSGYSIKRQAINQIESKKATVVKTYFGGLPLVTEYYGNPCGLTPKEYGIRYANGKSRKVKTNKRHRSHQLKLKHA